MIKRLEKYPILTIIITVVLILLPCFNYLDITIMEARNFITAREMINDGNWLLTTMNGEPRYQKPPLPTWLAALSALVFGTKSLLAFRLPAILMVIIMGISNYLLTLKLINNKNKALINALITITSFYVIGIVIEAPWDIFTHGFMLFGLYNLFLLFEKSNNYWKHTLLSGVFIGLSILSKGPVSLYVLFLPFLIAYGLTYKYKNFKVKIFSIFSLLILAISIGGWWYLYVRLEDPETFLAIANKETGNWSSYNVRPFYYYWSFFTQSGLWTIPAFISLLYPYLKTRVSNLKAYKFTLLWTVAAVVLLSVIPEKKSRYLMPVLIPLALNIGSYIEYLIKNFKQIRDKRETIPVYFNFGLIASIGILFPVLGFFLGSYLKGQILFWFILSTLFLLVIGVSMLIHLKRKSLKQVFYLSVALVASICVFALPMSRIQNPSHYNPIKKTNNAIKVYSLGYVSPEMIWLYGDKIESYNHDKAIREKTFGLLTNELSEKDKKHLETKYTLEHIDTYDLNKTETSSRKYRSRLKNDYFILTKR
ncbi:glycosyltransferase family 39 protein [Seonamhaeicola sp. ML3]|uniref:ArnT family glycosyltransferase n=1 Tax=Seonamhaeicola sp. ML3 TaxID=2937786 RepID=UPI00200D1E9D|nr:glycosyltransferase family 39 protein [Seonamhaeicola sp. ML3]